MSSAVTWAAGPASFLASAPDVGGSLGSWLSPLVVEADGSVVPLTYGFAHRYGLGNIHSARLEDMAKAWDPDEFLAVCRLTAEQLLDTGRVLFSWYEEVCARARGMMSTA